MNFIFTVLSFISIHLYSQDLKKMLKRPHPAVQKQLLNLCESGAPSACYSYTRSLVLKRDLDKVKSFLISKCRKSNYNLCGLLGVFYQSMNEVKKSKKYLEYTCRKNLYACNSIINIIGIELKNPDQALYLRKYSCRYFKGQPLCRSTVFNSSEKISFSWGENTKSFLEWEKTAQDFLKNLKSKPTKLQNYDFIGMTQEKSLPPNLKKLDVKFYGKQIDINIQICQPLSDESISGIQCVGSDLINIIIVGSRQTLRKMLLFHYKNLPVKRLYKGVLLDYKANKKMPIFTPYINHFN